MIKAPVIMPLDTPKTTDIIFPSVPPYCADTSPIKPIYPLNEEKAISLEAISMKHDIQKELLHRHGALAFQLFHDQAEAFFCQHRHPLLWFDLIFDGL